MYNINLYIYILYTHIYINISIYIKRLARSQASKRVRLCGRQPHKRRGQGERAKRDQEAGRSGGTDKSDQHEAFFPHEKGGMEHILLSLLEALSGA